jgi:hypothetical protein
MRQCGEEANTHAVVRVGATANTVEQARVGGGVTSPRCRALTK